MTKIVRTNDPRYCHSVINDLYSVDELVIIK